MKSKNTRSPRFLFQVNLQDKMDQIRLAAARQVTKQLNKAHGHPRYIALSNLKDAAGRQVTRLRDAVTADAHLRAPSGNSY